MIALLCITDGREHIFEAIPSALANLSGPITKRVIYYDDSDKAHATRLLDTFGPLGFELVWGQRRGFGGAIQAAWWHLMTWPDLPEFVFHLEDDFTFARPVDLSELALVLHAHPYLVQLALRRQPWNEEERAAGGIVESHPSDYREVTWWRHSWLEHRRFFTTNPSLYRSALCAGGWPDGIHSEGVFTQLLLAYPFARFGFWGARDSGEWVTHIGDERNGLGY